MLAGLLISMAALGISHEEQAALDALIEARQTARTARLEEEAAVAAQRMLAFESLKVQRGMQRKAARQSRLTWARQHVRSAGPNSNFGALQRAVIEEAFRRQFVAPNSLYRQ
jgi:hypothetical protein